MSRHRLFNPELWLPDRGEIGNPGWLIAENVVPQGAASWMVTPALNAELTLASSAIRGMNVNPANGTPGWKIYYGTNDKIYEVDPVVGAWAETDRSGAVYTPNDTTGWQFTSYGPHEIWVGGDTQLAQIRLSDAGNFSNLITNAEPVPPGGAATGNWPPKPKFVAQWGLALVIANMTDVGPASQNGDPNESLLWTSDKTGRIFTLYELTGASPNGLRSTFSDLTDKHGPITALIGGDEFGVVGKSTAIYRANFGGPFRHDIRVATSQFGMVHPNGWAWAGQHELYLMTTAGPAVMTQSGIRLLATDKFQRTLFDPSWLVDTYETSYTGGGIGTSVGTGKYKLHCTYEPLSDIVSWYYIKDETYPDTQLDYHRSTGRSSVHIRNNLFNGIASFSTKIYGAVASPKPENENFFNAVLALEFSGVARLFTYDSSSDVSWISQPKFRTPYLELAGPAKAHITKVRPRYTLNDGETTAPKVTVIATPKNRYGLPLSAVNKITTSFENPDDGTYNLNKSMSAYLNQIEVSYGDLTTSLADVSKIAEIEGFDIFYEVGGAL